jgi:two-component system LytT family response regulator
MPPDLPRIRAVIVDDEELARRLLREYLAEHPDIEIVAECGNGFEAVKAVNDLKPDLLFLDIQMPKLNGFEMLELLDREPAVVFITAYDEHALRAFEVHAVDYVLKPFSPERLSEALARASARLAEPNPLPLKELAASARHPDRFLERVLVRDGSKVHVLPVETIDFIEAQDDYIALKSGGKSYLKQQTLAEVEGALDPASFVRIHRSYVLNVERLSRIELYAKDSRIAILTDGSRLPLSRAGYQRLKTLL